jgi:hypothetical protein
MIVPESWIARSSQAMTERAMVLEKTGATKDVQLMSTATDRITR